jgi:hypothetical protein
MLVWNYKNVCEKGNIMLVWYYRLDAFADLEKMQNLIIILGASKKIWKLWSLGLEVENIWERPVVLSLEVGKLWPHLEVLDPE